jgi:hypothetical protein
MKKKIAKACRGKERKKLKPASWREMRNGVRCAKVA